ncbi:unnamed protein product [Spirodela intermedia]|uniref:Uncharacterized protein n=2 Tax=Spirodela intermedia TaxID=51605 RepID=A0A7I8KKR6_SPIIN|nr:unnamed protein product [Spirodela intermedia]CAA6662008.1 unnamed protein product [Spirodela intermedia]CAA7398390.1 unnamed protein product [Spirodela intermedia]
MVPPRCLQQGEGGGVSGPSIRPKKESRTHES